MCSAMHVAKCDARRLMATIGESRSTRSASQQTSVMVILVAIDAVRTFVGDHDRQRRQHALMARHRAQKAALTVITSRDAQRRRLVADRSLVESCYPSNSSRLLMSPLVGAFAASSPSTLLPFARASRRHNAATRERVITVARLLASRPPPPAAVLSTRVVDARDAGRSWIAAAQRDDGKQRAAAAATRRVEHLEGARSHRRRYPPSCLVVLPADSLLANNTLPPVACCNTNKTRTS